MSKEKIKAGAHVKKHVSRGARYSIPFFVVLAVLTVVAFIIPLRPTQSWSEKRALAEFPEFSLEALVSGEYFDDINIWFSDTFPGRESWVSFAQGVEELYGVSDIVIHGDLPVYDSVPKADLSDASGDTEPTPQPTPAATEQPNDEAEPLPSPEAPTITTAPDAPVEEWGGVDAGDGADIILGTVIQIEDFAFSYFGFSQYWSDVYVSSINGFAEKMRDRDVDVVSVLIPTSVGVMVEPEYLEKLKCADHAEVIDYMNSAMDDSIIKVDVLTNLRAHNDEYIYFRTDHHWTALGAYYAYESICETLDMLPAALEDFEEWDQGEFLGSFYWSCNQSSRLKADTVYAYDPPGDLETYISEENNYAFPWTVLTDVSHASSSSKYMVFLAGDHPLTTITNNDIDDDSSCVVIKGSFGNPLVPYLTQNYHTVYAIDYRSYSHMTLSQFVEYYDVDQVIFLTTVGMVQSEGANNLIAGLCR